MVSRAKREAEKISSDTHHINVQHLAPLMSRTRCEPKYITIAQQNILNARCKPPVLVSAQAADLVQVAPHKNLVKMYVFMTARKFIDVYEDHPFYIIVANFSKVDVDVLNNKTVLEVADAPVRIGYVTNEYYSYASGAHANDVDSSVRDVHYRPTPEGLKQMARHDAEKKKDVETLKQDLHEDVQLLVNFIYHQPAFSENLGELESI